MAVATRHYATLKIIDFKRGGVNVTKVTGRPQPEFRDGVGNIVACPPTPALQGQPKVYARAFVGSAINFEFAAQHLDALLHGA